MLISPIFKTCCWGRRVCARLYLPKISPGGKKRKKNKEEETSSLSSPVCSSFDSDLSLSSLASFFLIFLFFLQGLLREQSFLFATRGDSSAPSFWSPTLFFKPIYLNYKTNSVTFLRERHRALNCVNWENWVLQFWSIKDKPHVLYNPPIPQLPLGITEIPSSTRISSLFVVLSSAGRCRSCF